MIERRKTIVGLLLLAILQEAALGRQYTLNVPRVLLPIVPASGVKANFTLTSQAGCFTWKSIKPDVASVKPLYSDEDKEGGTEGRKGGEKGGERGGGGGGGGEGEKKCSREAILTPQSSEQTRLSTVIIAEEQTTGQTLRCDVFVDTVQRIEITTRTRELLLEEEPERFEILGFDEEGNTFSTLRGHKFDWALLRDEEATHQTSEPEAILHFVKFDDSSYSTDPIIGGLEAAGSYGDTVLVEGVSTGTAKVSVGFLDKAMKDGVTPAVVKLLVIENIMLQPACDVYILPYCVVHYTVERKKQGKTEVVEMPSDQYSLELTNTTVGVLDSVSSNVTGLVVGDTEVVLQDKNMLHTPSATKPTAGIHVVPPHHLGYTISPNNIWVLEVGRQYEITVHIFDKFNHPILVTENVVMSTTLPTSHLTPITSSSNGSYHFVAAETVGKATIHATLKAVNRLPNGPLYHLTPVVSKDQPLEIYQPIRLLPEILVILWDPATEIRYQHQMEATGGSGGYVWSCDREAVSHVTSTGLVTSVSLGQSVVTASDKKNSAHFDTSQVFVVPPADMLFLPSRVEAVIGSTLSLPLQVRGLITLSSGEESLEPFTDCRRMSLSITASEPSVFNFTIDTETDPATLAPGACVLISALALLPGHTKLTVQYSHSTLLLTTSLTIASYPPLLPIDPPSIAILTLGSSYDFIFEGGPAPWVLDKSKYYQRLTAADPTWVWLYGRGNGEVIRGVGQHVWRVSCRDYGEQELTLDVGNGATLKNAHPATECAIVNISCALPVSMTMTPVVDLSKDCALLQSTNQNARFPVKAGQALELEVKVYDAENRAFSNFSSLEWRWGSSDLKLLRPPGQGASLVHRRGSGYFLLVQLSQQSGAVVMTASSDSYKPHHLAAEKIEKESNFSPGVNHSLSLLLRQPPVLTPSFYLLYNHHDNYLIIQISNGSGYFKVETLSVASQKVVATAEYSDLHHTITLSPLSDGEVTVRVRDLCLASADEVVATVIVAGLHSLSVQVSDKVQLGGVIQAFVRVLDGRGNPFTVEQHRFMQLEANPKSHHIHTSLVAMDTTRSHATPFSSVFDVLGRAVGHTHLLFNVTSRSGQVTSSIPAPIQVFDALKLTPEYITLLPTATFQIHASGGPMLEAAVKFSISNPSVATVIEDTGLIEAIKSGKANITGKAQATDPVSGHMTSYSEDEVYLSVVLLTGIRISVATTRILAGSELSTHAVGLNDESPFTFASALPGLTFQWSSTNMDVVSLSSVYEKAGVSLQEEQDFAARLRSHNPGIATVKLVATCPAGLCQPDRAVFQDEVKIEVISPLTLLRPHSGRLLVPQGGRTRIITSRDGVSTLSYKLFCNGVSSGDDGGGDGERGGGGGRGDEGGIVSVNSDGEIVAGNVNGHAVVIVTASEEDTGLNQSAIVHIEIGTVVGLSLSPLSLAQASPNSKHHAFPLGYSAEFRVTLLDGSGRAFDFAEIQVSYRLNRFDIVRVTPGTNGTYVVKAASKGQVILKVFVSLQPRISDYIRVHVGYAIIPSLAVVHVGSKVCFTTHLTEESSGEWSTGEGGVMQLTPETGVGLARSPGRAVIYHKIKGVSDTHTEITVKRVAEVIIRANEKELPPFTNAQRQKELGPYSLPVSFYHEQSTVGRGGGGGGGGKGVVDKGYFTALLTSPHPACAQQTGAPSSGGYVQQVPFHCVLELRDGENLLESERFVTGLAYFDHKYGVSSCVLLPAGDQQGLEFLSTKERLSLSLRVKGYDSGNSYEVFSSPLSVPLVPAFAVSRNSITLTSADPSTTITVTGLPHQLQAIQTSSPHPLSVTKHTSSAHTFTFLLTLTERHPEPFTDLPITFTSSLTHQVTTVAVSYSDATVSGANTETTTCQTHPLPTTGLVDHETPPIESAYQFIGDNLTLSLVFIVTTIAIVIGLVVVCKALRDSSPKTNSGFAAYLPRSPTGPQHQAFSPSPSPHSQSYSASSVTPGLQRTPPPIPGSSGGQSAFRRTGVPRFSPSSQGLYST